ncbi:serine/threonine-protein kinase [Haliea sp. E17]|uniref:serine/threonine-protein kinase n=1 Tax=Haliea sp. E17 TaxID=3401576 RepID=UPI003AAB768E
MALDSRIGPYSIRRLIREGGQGRVYLGYDQRLNRQVAIKIHAMPGSRQQRRRALAEARKAAKISDTRIVQIYDIIESRGFLAIVMEYVPGCDLEELIGRERLSVPAVIRVGIDLAAALDAARQEKLVHGDLKAGNVLVTREGRLKLADFGIAREAGVDGGSAGSPAAIAPEQLRGMPADQRSDLFCLGCLLFRLLSGEHPFASDGVPDSERLLHADTPALATVHPGGEVVPRALALLLGELLQQDPEQRPRDMHRVRSLLRAAKRDFPLSPADALVRQAEAYFRPETEAEIPPNIPGDLRKHGRSRLVRRGLESWLQKFQRLRLSTRLLVVTAMPLLAAIVFELATLHLPRRVHFEAPEIVAPQVPSDVDDFGQRWLMQAVQSAVESRIGPIHVSGQAEPKYYFVELAGRAPQIVISSSLRCSEVVCLFFVSRRDGEGFRYQHALIPPELPRRDWEAVVRDSTAALFP